MAMRVSIGVGGANSGRDRDFDERVAYVVEAERLGVDTVWTAEAWGQDAVAPLAFLAARTERIRLGTGIMQISARAPAMTAMTALTMAAISHDRFILGLGVSGPQVVEGLHNQSYRGPLTRLKETVEIVKLAFAGERLQYDGKYHQLPLPGGEGKALRLSQPGNPNIPIYLATIGPKALEYTGEMADGWLGTSFIPEHAEAHLSYLRAGVERAERRLESMDIQVGGTVAFGDDLDALIAVRKPGMAFTLGAMGSARTNFYNDAFRRAGWEDACREVQQLWVAGRREEASARVPDEMVIQANFLGDDNAVRERIRAYRSAGVTTLRLAPEGRTLDERLETLGRAIDLVRAVDRESERR